MTIRNTPALRSILLLDGVVSGAAGVAMAAGASLLASFLELPQGLLFWAGIVLLPWCAVLVWLSRRETMPRAALVEIAAINVIWVLASFGLMLGCFVQPNGLGIAFVTAQALAVALFAVLQVGWLRREPAAA